MKKYQTEWKWGILFTVVMLVWMGFERLMGWHGEHIDRHAVMTNFFAVPAIAVYVLALLDKRKTDFGGVMTWKQGFFTGLVITLVVVILSPAAQLLTHTVISPHYFEHIIEHTVTAGQMSREEAESWFTLSSYMFQSAIGALVMGLVTSAVVAVFTRKKA